MASTSTTSTSPQVPPHPGGAPRADVVLIPVKAFCDAKARLGPVLSPGQRSRLAQGMAARVIAAGAPAPVWVVCDDERVADFARRHGAEVCWTPGLGLNGAVAEALAQAAAAGLLEAIVAHADLPFARDLSTLVSPGRVVVFPDRHADGTNVMAIPTDVGFRPAYGAHSAERHRAEADRLGREVQSLHDSALSWDVDTADDLWPPSEVGEWPDELPRPAPAEPCRSLP